MLLVMSCWFVGVIMVYKKKKMLIFRLNIVWAGLFLWFIPPHLLLFVFLFKLFTIISISLRLSAFLFYPHMFLKVPLTFALFWRSLLLHIHPPIFSSQVLLCFLLSFPFILLHSLPFLSPLFLTMLSPLYSFVCLHFLSLSPSLSCRLCWPS